MLRLSRVMHPTYRKTAWASRSIPAARPFHSTNYWCSPNPTSKKAEPDHEWHGECEEPRIEKPLIVRPGLWALAFSAGMFYTCAKFETGAFSSVTNQLHSVIGLVDREVSAETQAEIDEILSDPAA
ncbi:hypothetical protein FBU59_001901 [Linderina macrospora]|uniref:Uncharacterized protein n=1 Tax=Linderina macrospora TaxID=4868 RepID=A0ACC1JCR0_9FUNG|nr:hypothetical protein FBU59_001901 [Linderina macrospora]